VALCASATGVLAACGMDSIAAYHRFLSPPTVIGEPHKDCASDVMEASCKEIAMKSFSARSVWAMLGLLGLVQPLAAAESFGSASLLPMPSTQQVVPSYHPIAPTSYGVNQEEISPSDQAPVPAFSGPPTPELSPDYKNAMKQSWDGAGCADGACGDVACGRACPRFFVYAGGLVLGRANQGDHALTQEAPGSYNTILSTNDANQDWAGGFEARAGWIMPNCCNAIEIGYWGLFPEDQVDYVNADNYTGIRPALGVNHDQVWYDDGQGTNQSVYDWMSTATGTHYITRSFDFHSVEANFLGNTYAWGVVPYGASCGGCNGCVPCGGCGPSRWQFGWLAGFRYFQFNESLWLQSDYNDTMIGDSGDYDELTHYINTDNTLLGFQMGGQGAWYLNHCWSIYGGGRFGVFNNHIEASQYISGLGGDAYINAGGYAGEDFRFDSDKDALAGLGQIDLGLRYQAGCHWSVTGGYRVVGIAGVATSPSQIPDNFADPRYVQNIDADDSVILHGAYLGAQFAW